MNLNFDIFEEFENNIFQRFSSIILFVYLYYSLSYYFITDDKINKPHIFFILILLILHLIHIICLKILHKNNLITYSWILAMAPLVLYLLYIKYKERVNLYQINKEEEMMQKLRNQMMGKIDKNKLRFDDDYADGQLKKTASNKKLMEIFSKL